jgi:hypothetical protein
MERNNFNPRDFNSMVMEPQLLLWVKEHNPTSTLTIFVSFSVEFNITNIDYLFQAKIPSLQFTAVNATVQHHQNFFML